MFQVQPDEDDDDFEMRGRAAFGNVTFRELTMTARSGGFATREPAIDGTASVSCFTSLTIAQSRCSPEPRRRRPVRSWLSLTTPKESDERPIELDQHVVRYFDVSS